MAVNETNGAEGATPPRVRERRRKVVRARTRRRLLADWKFVLAVFGSAVVFVGIGVALPKVWVVTPQAVTPVLRISLLDFLQARMLARTAKRLASEGRNREASVAWAGALGNHPANRENLRRFVDFALNTEGLERRWTMFGAMQAQWLVTLSGTNDALALELAGRMCARAGFNEQAWLYLQTTNRVLSVPAARAMADVAFKSGRLKEFVDVWERRRDDLAGDLSLVLYRSAWLALAGPPAEQALHMAALDKAAGNPALAAVAYRLRSMVEAQRLDLEAFQRSFEELRGLREDELEDHIRSWLVLEVAGDHAAAVARATAYAVPPETGEQARLILMAWSRLRLDRLAVGFVQNQLDSFPNDPLVWFLSAQMLVREREWDDLKSVVLRLRRSPALSGFFAGYIDFLEGVSESGLGRDQRARELFARMLRSMPSEPVLGLEASNTLERMGFWADAQAVLRSLESVYGGRPDYWYLMGRLAWQDRNSAALLLAAEKAHRMDPRNPEYRNLFGAALLICRVRPAEALEITLSTLQQSGGASAAIINHSFSLSRVGRVAEARKLLADLPVSAVTDEDRTFWRMSMFEIELADGNRPAAMVHLRGIDPQYLYGSQRAWIEERRKEIEAAAP